MANNQNIAFALARVPGLLIRSGPTGQLSVLARGLGTVQAGSEPLFLLDGIQITGQQFQAISPATVDHIDVLTGPEAAVFGSGSANGVVAVWTRRGGTASSPPPSADRLVGIVEGLTPWRQFYSPEPGSGGATDLRNTLYWTTDARLGPEQALELRFAQADRAGDLRVTVAGITPDGRIVVGSQRFAGAKR